MDCNLQTSFYAIKIAGGNYKSCRSIRARRCLSKRAHMNDKL
ncbi:hypothetical protein JMJ77_0003392 [Colletotrichum scovillei]|uniref:Uncharacterized protein n=1 Tax=Colletotrichum scovillei TaxID=1209932 RepID=A0A9P7QQR2_9PEZI|nr:hypothetical protein JMJ78_0004900 [Colletotrichum scovillei]KAG7041285.1 hypothetical protein JMJ77_0003392 [Colletotrichum scovillei]KAG7061315.1 hypothetical protein JMJ76_0000880 [Colletotrichum scovillei]